MTSIPYDAQDTTQRAGTVGEFAAFALDCVAEGLGGAKLVLLTEDHIEGDGDFLGLDQHANEDGTFTRDSPVEWSALAFMAFTEHLTEDQGFALLSEPVGAVLGGGSVRGGLAGRPGSRWPVTGQPTLGRRVDLGARRAGTCRRAARGNRPARPAGDTALHNLQGLLHVQG